MSHSRQPSLEAGSGSSATARNTSNSGQRGDDTEDPMNAVYKAIVDNPDFINRLADHLRSNPGGLRGPRGPAGAAGTPGAVEGGNGHWRADEVGFFFPDLHSSYGSSDIVTIGKDSFYRNATVFLDRLDDIVKLRGGELVRSNIPSCLRGAALQWYTTEVSDIEKASLRSPSTQVNPQDPLHRWKIAIHRRWDPPASVALQNFMTTRYTFPMALAGVSMMQYFSTKIRLAKEAGFADTHKQLLAVWNGLDVEIREHIPEPDEDMSLERFRKGLEERERLWKEKLLRNRVRSPVNGQHFAGNVSYSRDFPPRSTDPPIRSNERVVCRSPGLGFPSYLAVDPRPHRSLFSPSHSLGLRPSTLVARTTFTLTKPPNPRHQALRTSFEEFVRKRDTIPTFWVPLSLLSHRISITASLKSALESADSTSLSESILAGTATERTLRYYRRYLLHHDVEPEPVAHRSSTMSHSRQGSLDASSGTGGSSGTARNSSSTGGNSGTLLRVRLA
jgi:hypothetical protein